MSAARKSSFVGFILRGALLLSGLAVTACTTMDRQELTSSAAQPSRQTMAIAATMRTGSTVPAPIGFLNFCARLPDECGLDDSASAETRRATLVRDYYWSVVMKARPDAGLGQNISYASFSSFRQQALGQNTLAEPAAARDDAGAAKVILNDETMTLLRHANSAVNQAIIYRESDDADAINLWRLPLEESIGKRAYGDCKDYVLEKRRVLIEQGLPAESLAIALAETFQGQQHAVLLVSTDQGELVLDSLTDRIKPWNKSGLHWISRQAPGQTFAWVEITGAA